MVVVRFAVLSVKGTAADRPEVSPEMRRRQLCTAFGASSGVFPTPFYSPCETRVRLDDAVATDVAVAAAAAAAARAVGSIRSCRIDPLTSEENRCETALLHRVVRIELNLLKKIFNFQVTGDFTLKFSFEFEKLTLYRVRLKLFSKL